MLDNSKYKANHDKIIDYVKHQIGIDLNNYRNGNGESPYTTTFWDLNGPMVCVNWCGSTGGMSESIQNRIMSLATKGKLTVEWGGAWFKYIGLNGDDVSDNIDCTVCKERFMCDRVKYECPREDPPHEGDADELSSKEKVTWAVTYEVAGYKIPKELEAYL